MHMHMRMHTAAQHSATQLGVHPSPTIHHPLCSVATGHRARESHGVSISECPCQCQCPPARYSCQTCWRSVSPRHSGAHPFASTAPSCWCQSYPCQWGIGSVQQAVYMIWCAGMLSTEGRWDDARAYGRWHMLLCKSHNKNTAYLQHG